MIEFPKNPGNISPKFVTTQLNETIKNLSDSQRQDLLRIISKWGKDKRKYSRTDYKADVIFSDNNLLTKGMIENISAGGLYLHSEKAITVGKAVTVCFENPFTEKQVKVNGKTVRNDQNGVAIKFDQALL